MKRYLFLLPILGCTFLAGCPRTEGDIAQRQVRVVATTGMIADLVRQVGGDRVEVVCLMGPGVDPHLYQAKESDLGHMSKADILFYNGLHLEGKMGDVFEKMKSRTKTVAITSKFDAADLRPAPPGFEGTHDPHVWFDVTLWMKATDCVRDALSEADPGSKAVYHNNAAAYRKELEKLHAYVQSQAIKVPSGQRVLITAHDAFYYFGHRYGFQVRGLQGVSTQAEASPTDVAELARFIADNKIPALFIESSVPVRNLEAVQRAVEARGAKVTVGGELFSDALGDPNDTDASKRAAATYVGMVRYNIDTIVAALK